jgi:RNA polymerase sigma-70 factor (sigma-E family)
MRPLRERSAVGTFSDHRATPATAAADESTMSVRFEVIEIDSFERFYRSQYGPMVGLAYQLTGSRDVAEDLVQEGMLRAYREWGRISSYDRTDLWLRRAVVNLATSRWRRQQTAARSLFRLSRPTDVPAPSAEAMEVWRQVRRLPRRQAEVIALYYGCDLSVDDVAVVLDCTPGTISTHLVRARSALAELLQSEDLS